MLHPGDTGEEEGQVGEMGKSGGGGGGCHLVEEAEGLVDVVETSPALISH